MKKLIVFLISLVFVATVTAAEVNTSRKVLWEQDVETFAVMDHWELFWGNDAGGPYTKIQDVAKPTQTPVDGIYTLDAIVLTVTGQMGKTVTKYFVMRTVMPEGEKSEWSNEATSDFKIVMGVPFNFIIEVITKSN